jgi:uncharacterized protein (DUF302 family)
MATRRIDVERLSVTSGKSFENVLAALHAAIGHPEMDAFRKHVSGAKTFSEVEKVVQSAIGPSGLMEFFRLDHGEILNKAEKAKAQGMMRLIIGNPLIMRQMAQHVPDAGSYAPVTILIDQRADGVHLSYDRMASLLKPYGNTEALKIAQDLDSKVEALLTSAAG